MPSSTTGCPSRNAAPSSVVTARTGDAFGTMVSVADADPLAPWGSVVCRVTRCSPTDRVTASSSAAPSPAATARPSSPSRSEMNANSSASAAEPGSIT